MIGVQDVRNLALDLSFDRSAELVRCFLNLLFETTVSRSRLVEDLSRSFRRPVVLFPSSFFFLCSLKLVVREI